jgi:hypothetical protein
MERYDDKKTENLKGKGRKILRSQYRVEISTDHDVPKPPHFLRLPKVSQKLLIVTNGMFHIFHCLEYIKFEIYLRQWRNQGSSVSIATRLRDGRPRFNYRQGQWWYFLLIVTASRPALEPTQPLIQWVPGIKRPGCEADNSPPSSAEVKNAWSYTSVPSNSSSWSRT